MEKTCLYAEAKKWLNDIGFALDDDRDSRKLIATCAAFAEDMLKKRHVDNEVPVPFGDGIFFKEMPGGHYVVEGPGDVKFWEYSHEGAEHTWNELKKAYAYGFASARTT